MIVILLPISIIPESGTSNVAAAPAPVPPKVRLNSPGAYPTPCLVTSILVIIPPSPNITRNSAFCDDVTVISP